MWMLTKKYMYDKKYMYERHLISGY
jgi:hypothetical protein